jgi:hypothetical protein
MVMHIVPIFFALVISLSTMAIIRGGVDMYEKAQARSAAIKAGKDPDKDTVKNTAKDTAAAAAADDNERNVGVKIGPSGVNVGEEETGEAGEAKTKNTSMKETAGIVSQGIFDLIWAPIVIFITSFISVITALIYFKTRLAGGESMSDLLAQFEEAERPRSKWQERVRQRLQQSGRSTGRSGSKSPSRS